MSRSPVLVLNCGSSSVKAAVIDLEHPRALASARVERVGEPEPRLTCGDLERGLPAGAPHDVCVAAIIDALREQLPDQALNVVGHRVVHGGAEFSSPTRIDDAVVEAIRALVPLAPLHNPGNLAGIEAARRALPEALHVAVFDTAFHATLPRRARTYAVDHTLAEAHGVRRYGFHGPSHQWVARRAAEHMGEAIERLRIVTCHLGNGASVCAVEYGRSIETSMGMTPLEGLVMGTRSGDVDPGAVLAIARAEQLDLDGIDDLLNKRSGLTGLSGVGNDLRDIEARAAEGDDRCRLAMAVYAHRVVKYIGAYAAVMGDVDAIVFTAGVGENSAAIRHRIAQRLGLFGVRISETLNRDAAVDDARPIADIGDGGRCRLLVVRTDEQRAIAESAAAIAEEADRVPAPGPIPIAISARHIHLTEAAVETLFGAGHQLTPRKDLSQPGQFACEETLTVVGPKRSIESVRVLGPTRGKNQVEISRTDEFHLGIDAPVRRSGHVEGSAGVTLVGPAGRLELSEGVICAWRHIHMTPEDAKIQGVSHGDVVEVRVDSAGRDLVFGDVLVRVSPKYATEMHVDTDEANAAELSRGAEGLLMPTAGTATLRRKNA
jgi:acetate kinase